MSKIIVYNDDIHRKRREIMRRYRATHHDKVCEINRRSWNKNKEKRHIGQKQYAKIHPLASVHNGMMKRCGHRKNNNETWRHYYEKRGVTVCPEWRSFPEFEKWALANGYETGLQIDRINPDLGYSPSNCRFVTARENAINRRSTFRIEWGGDFFPLIKVYEQVKPVVSYLTFKDRIKRGWSVKDASERKVRSYAK